MHSPVERPVTKGDSVSEEDDDSDGDAGARKGAIPADDRIKDRAVDGDSDDGDDGDSSSNEEDDDSDDNDDEESDKKVKRKLMDRDTYAAARDALLRQQQGGDIPFVDGPRSLVRVAAEGVVKPGDCFDSRDNAELAALEGIEYAGASARQLKKNATQYVVVCNECSQKKKKGKRKRRSPGDKTPHTECLRHRMTYNKKDGCWRCTVANGRLCNGSIGRDDDAQKKSVSTAYGPQHLVSTVLRSVDHSKITPATVKVPISTVAARPQHKSFLKRVSAAANKLVTNNTWGDKDDPNSLSNFPCLIAALKTCGWDAKYETCTALEMKKILLEVAQAAYKRSESEREKECKKHGRPYVRKLFDTSNVPTVDPNKKFVKSYRIAPIATASELCKAAPNSVYALDYAHCTDKGNPSGVVGVLVGFDQNNSLIDVGECFFPCLCSQ